MQAGWGLGRNLGSRGAVTIHFQTIIILWDYESSIAPPYSDFLFLKNLLGGRVVWGRMDTCIHMAETLSSPPETTTTLLISSTPTRNVFVFKKDLIGYLILLGFPVGSEVKASASNVGDLGLIPGSGGSPGEGNGNPLQYSCLENSHGQRNLVGYCLWGHKGLDMIEWQILSFFHSDIWKSWVM